MQSFSSLFIDLKENTEQEDKTAIEILSTKYTTLSNYLLPLALSLRNYSYSIVKQ